MKLPNFMKPGTIGLATVALSLAMQVMAPLANAADTREKCQHHIQKAEMQLDQAIRRHGERSHQAEDRRRRLNAERERCWNAYPSWWNGHDNRWHTERDWDR